MGASRRALGWIDVSAEVLAAPDARSAHERLSRALAEEFHAYFVVRTLFGPDGTPTARYLPDGSAPVQAWPRVLADVDRHPLVAHLRHGRPTGPVTFADAVAAGHVLTAGTRELIEAVGLTVHQLALPVPAAGPGEVFALVAEEPFREAEEEVARLLQPVVAGLDRHIGLLARIEEDATAHRATPTPAPSGPALTPRELLVLHGIAGGSTVRGIAARLAISPRTVHKHQENLYRKLGAVDRLSAVLEAQRAGLLPVGERPVTSVPENPVRTAFPGFNGTGGSEVQHVGDVLGPGGADLRRRPGAHQRS
ncbi:regulatory LuxR family protein [Georgenia soli]|uniref:Regulatory LuxR family protein n=1 Tax=Georgenia soli TaxID=638953 RepID=A0A2A9EM03_9MICO|nr:helix-turn-helix transcriptional regulator [Georgenia soli]PFG39994.1 regulatory LuxR family protein [Georgenia soli]